MKRVHISDVVSIATGRLMSSKGLGSMFEVLNYMTGKEILQHEVPKVLEECRPYVLKQFPEFTNSIWGEIDSESIKSLYLQVNQSPLFYELKSIQEHKEEVRKNGAQ